MSTACIVILFLIFGTMALVAFLTIEDD